VASLFQNADDASQGKTHRSLTAQRESILRLLISCEIYSLAENDTGFAMTRPGGLSPASVLLVAGVLPEGAILAFAGGLLGLFPRVREWCAKRWLTLILFSILLAGMLGCGLTIRGYPGTYTFDVQGNGSIAQNAHQATLTFIVKK
jgi:hypothetical protein